MVLTNAHTGVVISSDDLAKMYATQFKEALASDGFEFSNDSTEVRLAAKSTLEHLKEVGKSIKHGPDYGNLFWNEKEGKVHWTMGDSDGEGTDTPDDIKHAFEKINAVTEVIIGDEWSPHDDPDWEEIEI